MNVRIPAESPYLSTRQAAEYLGVSRGWLETLRSRGAGPAYARIGARIIYDRRDLDRWVDSQRGVAASKGRI